MPNNFKLHTTPEITIEHLLKLEGGIQVMVPLNEVTLNSELINGIKWHEVVDSIFSPTITAGDLQFKTITIKASIQPDGKAILQLNNGKELFIDSSLKGQTTEFSDDIFMTRISGYSTINENLQFCFTLTKEVMRKETIAFLEEEFPNRSWEDVYGECITLEAQAKPDNTSIQALKSNWDSWGHHDIEFSNYFILLNQQKERVKKRYGWSTNTLRSIDTAVKKITNARNASSHQNLNEEELQITEKTIGNMQTLIRGFMKSMGAEEVERRCQQLEEKKQIIESLKKQIQL